MMILSFFLLAEMEKLGFYHRKMIGQLFGDPEYHGNGMCTKGFFVCAFIKSV